MLVAGFSSPVCGFGSGLGYVESIDYTCVRSNNLFICKPQNAGVLASYKGLQQAVKDVSQAMAAAGRLDVPSSLATLDVDGRIGGITTLGTRFLVAALARRVTPPPDVMSILEQGLSKEEETRRVAASADGIRLYITDTLARFPETLIDEPIVIVKETPADLPPPKSSVSPKVGMAIGGLAVVLIAVVAAAIGKVSSGGGGAEEMQPRPMMGSAWRRRRRRY